ncbi:MAG TPA: ABC transporter ATP-binding protein, partial [Ramlibacter sp.]
GLMPKVIDLCYRALEQLRRDGLAVLVVEQNTDRLLRVADDLCVLESGRTVWKGKAAHARADATLTARYLGLH